jgi:glycosyltransferase involved in cell wall biosynthesis
MALEPEVSVIIPARDEESNLAPCLDSLIDQAGVSFEIIVVDDHSKDRTRQIAQSYPQVRVLEARPLAPGWTGKANAIQTAIPVAKGQWFLFTDADTVHLPGSLERSLREANADGLSMLSYSPKQEANSFWERAIQPVVFAELSRKFAYEDINDPASPNAAANGQYILIQRSAYEAIGQHDGVKSSLLEDVELARAIKKKGRLRFRYGPDAVSARMYRGLPELVIGWTKNLAALFPGVFALAIVRLLESLALLCGPLLTLALLLRRQFSFAVVALFLTLVCYIGFARRLRKAGWSLSRSPSSVLGLPLFAYLLLRSYFMYRFRRRVSWKGRSYPT